MRVFIMNSGKAGSMDFRYDQLWYESTNMVIYSQWWGAAAGYSDLIWSWHLWVDDCRRQQLRVYGGGVREIPLRIMPTVVIDMRGNDDALEALYDGWSGTSVGHHVKSETGCENVTLDPRDWAQHWCSQGPSLGDVKDGYGTHWEVWDCGRR